MNNVKKENSEDLKNEYKEFLLADHPSTITISPLIDNVILNQAREILIPSFQKVLMKFLALHLVSSLFTLSICPQFGLRLFGSGHGLMQYFMQWGNVGCYTACGGFYFGVTAILATLVFSKAEWTLFFKHRQIQTLILIFISMGVFIMFGAQIELNLALVWFLGGMISTSFVSYLRQTLIYARR